MFFPNDRRSSARCRLDMSRALVRTPRNAPAPVIEAHEAQYVPTREAIIRKLMGDSRIAFNLSTGECPAGPTQAIHARSRTSSR